MEKAQKKIASFHHTLYKILIYPRPLLQRQQGVFLCDDHFFHISNFLSVRVLHCASTSQGPQGIVKGRLRFHPSSLHQIPFRLKTKPPLQKEGRFTKGGRTQFYPKTIFFFNSRESFAFRSPSSFISTARGSIPSSKPRIAFLIIYPSAPLTVPSPLQSPKAAVL